MPTTTYFIKQFYYSCFVLRDKTYRKPMARVPRLVLFPSSSPELILIYHICHAPQECLHISTTYLWLDLCMV